MKKITLFLLTLLLTTFTFAQTTLTAGDIAFIGSNADGNENVSFVLLKDVDANTSIIFTDRGWSDTTGFTNINGDGELTWSSGTPRTAGEIITIDLSNGNLSGGGAYAIQGDQLFAIQGSIAAPIFIAGLHYNVEPLGGTDPTDTNDSNWDGTSLNNDESELPNALVNGVTAIRLYGANGIELDNFQFSCALAGGTVTGTPAQIRAIVNDISNWNIDNTGMMPYDPAIESGCTFTVGAAADTTPPLITCAPTPGPITAGVNGMAPIPDLVSGSSATDDTSDSGNIVITQSPTAGTMVGVGVTVVTVFATDEAGNMASCTINVTVNEPPSTVLTAGDIAFVGFNLDGTDGFAFILLKDIIAGTNIKLTDCGVNNPNTINCTGGDSTNTWYAPSAMSAGTIVSLDGTFFASPPASQGDQILAFQGTLASPIFIAGIHSNIEVGVTNDADWDGAAVNNDESALPNQLLNGDTAIRLHNAETEVDNWQFDCSLVPGGSPISGTATNIRAIINDLQYWVNSDTAEFVPAAAAGCSYTVIVSGDTTPPVISDCGPIPATITAGTNGETLLPDLTGNVVATDDVTTTANLTISQSPLAGSTITAGVTTVTLFVTDEAGNTATCTIDVTVQNPPSTTLVAGDIAFVGINQDGSDSFSFILLQNIIAGTNITFTDCGINNPNTLSCVGVNDATATWFSPTAMNAGDIVTLSGSFLGELSNLGDQIFAYQGDASAPIFIAGIHTSVVSGVTNDLDWDGANSDGFTTALPDQLTNGVNALRLYATGPPEAEVDNWQFDCTLVPGGIPISGTPAQIAAIINDIQYWISDDTNEFVPAAQAGCTYNVILDAVPPMAVCQDITVQLDAAGNATITATDVDGGSSDDSGSFSLSVSQTNFTCVDVGVNTVTLTVTDPSGNMATCTADVTIEDNVAPTAMCAAAFTLQLDASGMASITLADIENGSTDACGIASTSLDVTDFTCADVGVNTVTLTVTDVNGNISTCTTDVTVEDNVAPTAMCADPFTLQLDASGMASIILADIDNGSTDNCGIASASIDITDFTCADVGDNTVTLTVTDVNGNSSTCTTTVTIEDNLAPTAMCAAPFTVQLDATGTATITAADIDNGSTDNCGIASLTLDNDTFDCSNVGDNTVTLTVTDVSGNQAICTTTVTVEDNIVPVIVCPMDVVTSTNPDSCFATVNFGDPLVIDNCGTGDVTITQTVGMPSGSMFPVGISQIAFEVTDANGNSSQCSFTITVTDDTAPVAVCQDITVELDATGNVTITPSQLNVGSTDNCNLDTSMSSIDIDTFGCADVGDNTVTLTVSDSSGNTATCSATVTVVDNTAPVVTCNDITVELGADGTVTLDPAMLDGGSSDACGIATFTASPAVLDCGNLGVTEVTLTATDVNGNSSSCTALVTVEDNIAPILVCQEAVIELGADGTATIDPIQLLDLTEPLDNCGIEPLMVDVTEVDCSDVGSTITVTVTAMDASGNTSSCTTTITVVDVTGPTFDQASLPVGPIVRMINPATGIYRLEDFTVGVTATDGCSELRRPIAVSQSPFAGTELDEGTYDITITAMDEAGNDTDYVFELQVQPALGVEEGFDLSSLTLYPNPASDRITLSNPNGLQLDKAAIYDLQGRLIQNIDLTDMLSEKTIDVSQLQSATYMFVISSENGLVTKQIIKE